MPPEWPPKQDPPPPPTALDVLKEFVADVEAVGPQNVKDDWLDLWITYQHAKEALAADTR